MLSFPIIILALVVVAVLGRASYRRRRQSDRRHAVPICRASPAFVRSSALSIRENGPISTRRAPPGAQPPPHHLSEHGAEHRGRPDIIMLRPFIAQAIVPPEASLSS